ncbi:MULTISPECIES: serine hydrolase domain-containing protein [Rhodopseudomonas]|uniref:Beta-lactamase n=1 Tax=Rhodopseudomonas palustris TaxID=1076 RepID=A0A0D7ES98_RHOPL|nr:MULTISPECIES: serine hydrolase domain-containing protein [Rhodopseudomonas]KIZ43435.1 beta-lactamase [Rhodopseudomonas palustris]MDF3810187.1 serine hydrolase [Rhodopseudomonas sp. BAL398]WOK20172.1 serine hydrolase domain-containing protein [Rhodopseudomonas sp. BAL398]
MWRQAMRAVVGGALLAMMAAPAAFAQGTFDLPAGAHFSQEKLARIDAFFKGQIAEGKIPGAVLYIEQHGKPVYQRYFGVRDTATKQPMTDDTIFRLASLTKPFTAFAAMMLVERGKLKLDDPLSKYVPAFATVKVGVEKKQADGSKTLVFEPPKRPILISDLLLHTSGITYGFFGDSLVRKAIDAARIYDGNPTTAEFAERIARLPLQEQPGTLWDYGNSYEVLGRVIEVASGQSFYQFEKANLFDPLSMTDTRYFLTTPEQKQRMAQPMPNDADFHVGRPSTPDIVKNWESGGGGLVSTPHDVIRFVRMLLHGGELDGKRYLSEATFKLMTTDHIGPTSGIERDYFYFPGDGFGYGYGLAVRTDPGNAKPPPPGSLGELKWDGATGCYFVVDPKQDMFFVLMQQTPSQRQPIQRETKKLIYEAMEN